MSEKEKNEQKGEKINSDTIMYKPIKPLKENKKKEKKKKGEKKKHPKLRMFFKVTFVMILLLVVAVRRNTRSNCLSLYMGRLGNR